MATMTLDRWVSRRLVIVLVGSALVGLLASLWLIRERFHDLERWLVERQLERVERVLEQESAELERIAADYAHWDDTLAYLKGENPEFVTVNFPRNTGDNLNVDAVVIRNADGDLALSVDLSGDVDFQAWDDTSLATLARRLPAWTADGRLRRDSGLFYIDGRPAAIGRASVTDSAMEAPAQGSLVFVRLFDDDDIERLTGLADVSFALASGSVPEATEQVVRVRGGWLATSDVGHGVRLTISVPALLNDELYATGAALAAMAALNLVLCILLVRRLLARKVTGRLAHFVALSDAMGQASSAMPRWPVEGDDEIDRLADALNRLVDELDRHRVALDRLAHEDAVTGLANRRRLLECMTQRLAEGPAKGSLVYIDLVGFKPINDALGHAAGDTVLRTLAERMMGLGGPVVCAARIGGDEFGLLLDGLDQEAANDWFAAVVDGLVDTVECGGQDVRFDLIAGIAGQPVDGDASGWLSMADLAMYAARRRRMGRVGLYSSALGAAAQSRHVIATRLRAAMVEGGIEAFFQPILRLEDDTVVGVEALARWRVDDRWVPPSDFLPVMEEEGLMPDLTLLMLRHACAFVDAASASGAPGLVCSVNVSALQIANFHLAEQWLAIVRACGVAPSSIAFEVTEDAFDVRPESVISNLQAIRAGGFQLWLDDFGTGHSSLARLRDYPFDVLKVDRSFVQSRTEPKSIGLLEGIVRFGQRIGLSVTAEGVETAEDLKALREMGCDRIQGFHLARPMPRAEALAWLIARRSSALSPTSDHR